MVDTKIRWAIRRDLPNILDIENGVFSDPWTEDDFLNCFKSKDIVGKVICNCENDDIIYGFVIYKLYKNKYLLVNLAVNKIYQRKKLATKLIDHLVEKMESNKKAYLTAEIRERNLEAQLFFRTLGFKAKEVLRNYYEDTGEDGYKFIYKVKIPAEVVK